MKAHLSTASHLSRSSVRRFKQKRELRSKSYLDFNQPVFDLKMERAKTFPFKEGKNFWKYEIAILREAIKYRSIPELKQSNQKCFNSAKFYFPGLLEDFYGLELNGKPLVNTRKWIEITKLQSN
jgi:hypothetical protein